MRVCGRALKFGRGLVGAPERHCARAATVRTVLARRGREREVVLWGAGARAQHDVRGRALAVRDVVLVHELEPLHDLLEEADGILDGLELNVFVLGEGGRDSVLDLAVLRVGQDAEDGAAVVARVVGERGGMEGVCCMWLAVVGGRSACRVSGWVGRVCSRSGRLGYVLVVVARGREKGG